MKQLTRQTFIATMLMLCGIILFIEQSQAQVAVDSRSSNGAFSNNGVTTLSWTHIVGNGTNRALFVVVSVTGGLPSNSGISRVSSVSFNGTALTPTPGTSTAQTSSSATQVDIWQLINPPPGSGNIAVTFVPGTAPYAVGNAVSFIGVRQTNPIGNIAAFTGNGTTAGAAISNPLTITADDMGFDVLATPTFAGLLTSNPNSVICTTASETTCTRGRRFFSNVFDVGAASTEQATLGQIDMRSWTFASSAAYAYALILIKAAPPPTTATVTIGGRVITQKERGLANALVILTNEDGTIRYARTTAGGFYRFSDVSAGRMVVIRVASKRYIYEPRILTVSEEMLGVDFFAQN